MIYHIFKGRVLHLSPALIKGILDNFVQINNGGDSHFFCVLMTGAKMLYRNMDEDPYTPLFKEYDYTNYKIIYTNKEYISFMLKLTDKDKLIYHSHPAVKTFYIMTLSLIMFKTKVIRNSTFVCWGSDCIINQTSLKQRIKAFIMTTIFNNLKNIVTISPDDQKEVSQMYPNANVILAPYYSSKKIILLDKIKASKFHVMVSHSGWPHNNHQKSFELLRHFVGKIQVSCPLCYGDAQYIETVIKKGKEIFGNDFNYFKDLKTREEYTDFMRSVDAYVTSAEIQTGLGAVYYAIQSGAKVFTIGNVYNSLKSDNYIIYKTDDILNLSFQEFSRPPKKEECIHNIDIRNEKNKMNGDIYKKWIDVFYN